MLELQHSFGKNKMNLELYYYGKHNLELLKSIFEKRNFIYAMNEDIFFKEYSFVFN